MAYQPDTGVAIGDIAKGTADTGNPVKIGGVGSDAFQSAVAAGQRQNFWLGLNGQTMVGTVSAAPTDGAGNALCYTVASGGGTVPLGTMPFVFNGTTWDRMRGDTAGLLVKVNAALPAGTNNIGITNGPTLTKGTQGASGYSTQDLKDAGRTLYSAATVIAGVTAVTTEALLTMVPTRAGVAAATATTQAVTSGKRLRLTDITVGFISTAAAVLSMRFALRMNPAGAVTATSPILKIIALSSGAALAQAGNQITVPLPDGYEFSGTEQFGLTQIGSAVSGTVWASINGFEY